MSQLTLYNASSLYTAAGARLWARPQSQRHRRSRRVRVVGRLLTFGRAAACPSDTAALPAGLAALDALPVRDAGRGLALASFQPTNMVVPMRVDVSDPFRALPLTKVIVNRRPRGQVFGQVAPLAACARQIQDGIEQLAVGAPAGSARGLRLGEAIGAAALRMWRAIVRIRFAFERSNSSKRNGNNALVISRVMDADTLFILCVRRHLVDSTIEGCFANNSKNVLGTLQINEMVTPLIHS